MIVSYENLLEKCGIQVRDRWTGHQCCCGGSGPVVLDGATPVQGVRESRAQGEGV
jgi:hypothetical protein